MKIVLRLLIPALVAGAAFLVSERDAKALGPVDVEVGARVGVATNPDSDGPNPYGLGLGVRGGVSIFNIYGGLSFMHYLGSSQDVPGGGSVDFSSTLYGLELGYSIKAIPMLTLRPQLGIGNASLTSSVGSFSASSSNLYLEPGVTALVPLGLLYVGADVNLLLLPGVDQGDADSKTFTSLSIHGQVGVQF